MSHLRITKATQLDTPGDQPLPEKQKTEAEMSEEEGV